MRTRLAAVVALALLGGLAPSGGASPAAPPVPDRRPPHIDLSHTPQPGLESAAGRRAGTDARTAARLWREGVTAAFAGLQLVASSSDASEYASTFGGLSDDFDGDGLPDISGVTFGDTTTEVFALRGRTGAPLFSTTVATPDASCPTCDLTISSTEIYGGARVGPTGRPGHVTVSITDKVNDAIAGYRDEVSMLVTGIDYRGKQAWQFAAEGVIVESVAGAVFSHVPLPLSVADFHGGAASDLLLGTLDGLVTVGVDQVELQLAMVDGAAGAARDLGEPFTAEDDLYRVGMTPDLSGDQKADLLLIRDQGRQLAAHRATDLGRLWSRGTPDSWLYPLWDLTGDGRTELLVVGLGLPTSPSSPSSAPSSEPTTPFTLVDGAKGATLWSGAAQGIDFLGDINRDGMEDLLLSTFQRTSSGVTAKLVAMTTAGRRLWALDHAARGTIPKDASPMHRVEVVGQVDADRVWDIVVHVGYFQKQAAPTTPGGDISSFDPVTLRATLIDGRRGKAVREMKSRSALYGAVDGRGDDFMQTAQSGRETLVRRGETDAVLMKFRTDAATRWSEAARLDSDRCADLFVTVDVGSRTTFLVVDGGNGRAIWSRAYGGPAARVVSSGDANSIC